MKGYKRFISIIIVLIAIYIVAEVNRPEQIDWKATLSSKDKNPYGAYILFQQLKDLFPHAAINTYHLPVYNQLNQFTDSNTAYILIEPARLRLSPEDIEALLNYVVEGNYVFIAAVNISNELMDTLKLATKNRFELLNKGSSTVNFKNPALHAEKNYSYQRMTLDKYFSKYDTANTVVLGCNQYNDVNFIRMPYGEGAFFVHPLPLCFSNDFLLTAANADYTAKALSYLPKNIHTLLWDEYYKQDEKNAETPLRYILSNKWLRLAFRTGLLTILLFVFFEMKRKQQIIPVIYPLRNSTLDFVRTVGNVYFNKQDNKNIALKKISYFLESIRSGFNLQTNYPNEEFIQALAKKTALPEEEVTSLVKLIEVIQNEVYISDQQLLELNRQIDNFNKRLND